MTVKATDVDAIFTAALELSSPEERAAYLQRVCGDSELRQRVEELLAAHFQAGDFLEQPPATALYRQGDDIQAGPGTIIGPYKLLQQIGDGGMGVVFMAEQTAPIHRTVALKIIKPGMDTRQVIGRFEAERQALAMMDHPSIAKVLDAGTTAAGRPYFVMELVKGVPITKYCDDHKLTIRQRLELAKPVCEAVQHAHQKGVIHRDLKPTNILVAEYDNSPVPKVIDFGVAKATAQRLTERTMFTEFGQVIGTIEYMSPEQAKFNQLDIDTRSDIYSLGVLLFELLTGSTPFERERLREAAIDEVLRIIREEEPPRPSIRLSTSNTLPSIAANRHVEPDKLRRNVSGELDWIVMKCLDKDRNRRYETASGLANDIERYLNDEPVEACPPSGAYRLRKFARRNKGLLITASAVTAVLAVASLVSTHHAIRASHAEARALKSESRALANERAAILERDAKEEARREAVSSAELARAAAEAEATQRRRAEEVSGFLTNAFASPSPDRDGRGVTIAEVLDRAVQQLQGQLADDPVTKAMLLMSIGDSYAGLDLYAESIPPLEEAHQLLAASEAPAKDKTAAMILLAGSYRAAGREGESAQLSEEALRLAKTELGPDHEHTLAAMGVLADAYHAAGRLNDALELRKEVLGRTRAALGPRHVDTIDPLNELATSLLSVGRLDEATQLHQEAHDLAKALLGKNHVDAIAAMRSLGEVHFQANRLDHAIPLLEESVRLARNTLGPDHHNTLVALSDLAAAYAEVGRINEAILLMEESVALSTAKLGPTHPSTLLRANNLAVHYGVAGKLRKAVLLLEQNLRGSRAQLGSTHPHTVSSMFNLVGAYRSAGRIDEALSVGEEALQILRSMPRAERLYEWEAACLMASVYTEAEQFEKAVAELDRAIELNPSHWVRNRKNDLDWLFAKAAALKNRRPLLAIELATRATKLAPDEDSNWNTLGIARYRTGDWNGAINDFEKSMELRRGGEAEDWFFLAMAQWQLGRKEDARKWLDKAIAFVEEKRPTDRTLLTVGREAAELLAPVYDQDVAAARLLIEREPSGELYSNLGAALVKQGNYDDARTAFRKSIELRPDHPATYVRLIKAAMMQGNAEEAASTLRKLLQLRPNSAESLGSLATERIVHKESGHAYQRIDVPMSWHDARDCCALLGGHLATATSSQENDFLYQQFAVDHVCWLGATDDQEEGQWKWITDEPWYFANWGSGEPNNLEAIEHYLVFGSMPSIAVDEDSYIFKFAAKWADLNAGGAYVDAVIVHPLCEWDEHAPHPPTAVQPTPAPDAGDQP